jgi:hypothetical protein
MIDISQRAVIRAVVINRQVIGELHCLAKRHILIPFFDSYRFPPESDGKDIERPHVNIRLAPDRDAIFGLIFPGTQFTADIV